ncbi:MAG TPA: DoxX family protein [Edaphocola sp.]|nr:DoxX family protein [Edaphocola sp.]
MSKLMSTKYSKTAFNLATLILRVCLGAVMIPGHGWAKLSKFSEMQDKFMNFMGLGSQVSLGLVIFAEFFCAILLILGLFTRLAAIPLIVTMFVAITMAHGADIFDKGQLPFVLLAGFLAIFILGPGKISIDGLISKK